MRGGKEGWEGGSEEGRETMKEGGREDGGKEEINVKYAQGHSRILYYRRDRNVAKLETLKGFEDYQYVCVCIYISRNVFYIFSSL